MSLSSPWGRAVIDARMDLYLAPNAAGASNRNLGTQPDLPLATIDEAIARVNAMRGHTAPIVVHLASGAYSISEGVSISGVAHDAPVVFISDGAEQVGDDGFTLLDTTSALVGSTAIDIVTGLAGTAFAGKTLEFTSGALAGYRRTIGIDDGAGTLTLLNALPAAPGVGDVCRVVEPAVIISLPNPGFPASGRFGVRNCGDSAGAPTGHVSFKLFSTTSAVYFVNLEFSGSILESFEFNRATVVMLGCELSEVWARDFDDASVVVSGGDLWVPSNLPRVDMASNLGLAADSLSWGGWGVAQFGGALGSMRRFIGCAYSDTVILHGDSQVYYIGLVIAPVGTRAMSLYEGTRCVLEGTAGGSTVRLESTQAGSSRYTVGVVSDSILRLYGDNVVITRAGGGSCLVVYGENEDIGQLPGRASVGSGVTFVSTAGNNAHSALCVAGGGRINYRATPTLVGVWDQAEAKVVPSEASGPAAGEGGTLAALANRGDAYPDTAVTGAQALVNGIIQRQ